MNIFSFIIDELNNISLSEEEAAAEATEVVAEPVSVSYEEPAKEPITEEATEESAEEPAEEPAEVEEQEEEVAESGISASDFDDMSDDDIMGVMEAMGLDYDADNFDRDAAIEAIIENNN